MDNVDSFGTGTSSGYSITSPEDPRLQGIPRNFKSSTGFTLGKAIEFNAYDHFDDIYQKWMEENDWNMNIIRKQETDQNAPPKASYIPHSKKWREEEAQKVIAPPPEVKKPELTEKDKLFVEVTKKVVEGYKEVKFHDYSGVGLTLSLSERAMAKKLESKPIFDPEVHARSIDEMYPELAQMRDEASSRMVRMRNTLEQLSPKFRKLLNHSNKIFNSYIGDIHRHLQTVVLDHDSLKTEILKAERMFKEEHIERERRLYNREPPKDVGTFGKVLDVFSMMFSALHSVDDEEMFEASTINPLQKRLRETLEKTMTEKMIERERKASELLQELTETGVMDILNNVTEDGTAYLMNVENYEHKKKLLYAKLVEHVEQRDKEKLEMVQQRILDFQEFLLEDLRDRNSRTNEYELLTDVLKSTIGLKEKPQDMSWVDWEANIKLSKEIILDKRKRQKEAQLNNLKIYEMPWYEKAQEYTYKELFDLWYRNEEYPGNIKRVYEEKMLDYEERLKGEYNPGKFKKAWIGIQEIADGLMKMIPQVIATIPGMGKLSWGITKTAQIVNIMINNIVTRTAIGYAKPALKGVAGLLWKHKMTVMQLLAGVDPLTVGGSMAAIMLFKASDMMLLKVLNKGLSYIPGYDPMYLNGAIEFAGADKTAKWKFLQEGLTKIEQNSKGATHAVFSGMKRYLPLALRLKETSKYAEVIKSSAYREQRMMDQRILMNMANMDQRQMQRYNPENILQPAEGSYTSQSLQGDGIGNVADGLLYHLIQHNRSNFKNPMDAWKKTFHDMSFSEALFGNGFEDPTKGAFDTGNAAMTNIKKEANEKAAFEVKAILKELMNVEGIPTISEMKKYIDSYTSDLKTLNREQLAIESEMEFAKTKGNRELVERFSEKLHPLMQRKYKLLYKTSFFKELGFIAQNNHDTISRLSQLSTVFTSEHRDLYSLIPPLAPNAQELMEQHWNSDTVNAWQFKDVLKKLHQPQIGVGGGEYNYSTVAAMIAEKAQGMDKDITETGEYTLFNLSALASATTQGRYLEDLHKTDGNGAILGVINLVTNLTKSLINKGFESVAGGMLGTAFPVAVANFMFSVVPLAVSTGAAWTALSVPFMSDTIRSMLTAQLFSSGVVVPFAEWLFGETYSQMMSRSSKYKKASTELDQKAAETFTLHKKKWDLERRNKLEAAFTKKIKYQAGLSRAARTYSSTKERLEKFSASDKVKKLQAAENRLIAEEVQYEQLLNDIEKEIKDLEGLKYKLPEKDDLIPGYTDLKRQYDKEVSSRSWGLSIIEHATNIPQYLQWLALIKGYSSILSNPWKYGKVKDSTGKEQWMFPASIHQLTSGYDAMDESLGIKQSSENSLYELYDNKDGEANIPPSEYIFHHGYSQSFPFADPKDVPGAINIVEQKTAQFGEEFIRDNFVMVDTKTFKVYENPLQLLNFAIELRRLSMEMHEKSMSIDMSQPFSLIPDTETTRSMLGTGERSVFDENQDWSTSIDEIVVRLMPKAFFEGVPGTGIGIPKELTPLYKHILQPFDEAKYGDIYDVLLSRIDKSRLQFEVNNPHWRPDHPEYMRIQDQVNLSKIFPEFGETSFTATGGFTNTKMREQAGDTSWYLDKINKYYESKDKLSMFALTETKPGAPFTEAELQKMTVLDTESLMGALRKKFGTDAFRSKEEMAQIQSFIQERSVTDLVSTINREKALSEANLYQYGKAWSNFAWAWFYSGIQYRVDAFTDVVKMTGKLGGSWFEQGQSDDTLDNIKKLESVKKSLSNASTLFTKIVSTAEGTHLNAYRPQPEKSEHADILAAINAAYGLFKDDQGVLNFGKGHKLTAPLTQITPTTPIKFYLDRLTAIGSARQTELKNIRSSENITTMAKIFTALGHDLITKMVGTLQIYFEAYESVYKTVFPTEAGMDWMTGVPSVYRTGVFNYVVGPIYSIIYLGTDILLHYGVGGIEDKLQESEDMYYKGGNMEQFYKNLAATKIPTLGEIREDVLPTDYQPYDLKAILEESRTDRLMQFCLQTIQSVFEFTWSLSTLSPENPVAQTLMMGLNFVGHTAAKTMSFFNGVGEALDYLSTAMGRPAPGTSPDKTMDGVTHVDFSPEAIEQKNLLWATLQAFSFAFSDGTLNYRRGPVPTKTDNIPGMDNGQFGLSFLESSDDPNLQALALYMKQYEYVKINEELGKQKK